VSGRLVGPARALLRRRRAERDATIVLFLLVLATGFVAAAAPRWLDQTSDAGLRYEIAAGTAAQRNLQFSLVGQLPGQAGDPLGRIDARGQILYDALPGSVADVIASRVTVIESSRFSLTDPPEYATHVTLGHAADIDDHIEYVEGRAPGRAVQPADGEDGGNVPRFEIALAVDAAKATGMQVGQTYASRVDPSDPLVRTRFPIPTGPAELTVTGLYRPVDPTEAFWFDETRMAEAAIGGTDDNPIANVVGIIAPDAYLDLLGMGLPTSYRWRFFVDPDRFEAARIDALTTDLRRLGASYGPATVATGNVVYRSGLLDIIDRFEVRRAATIATLSIAAIGPLAVAAGAIALIALIIVRRRRPTVILARSRGASAAQLVGSQVVEGLLITIPAATLALALAMVVLPGRWNGLSAIGAFSVALATTGILVAATWPLARRARGDLERPDLPPAHLSVRRLVVEATIVLASFGAVWLLRERTLTGGSAVRSSEGPAGFDPFLAAAPVLVGIAVGLLAIRAYPLPVRAVASALARRRDLVPVLGVRSIGRHPGAASLPLLVLTLTVAIGVFASVVSTTVARGQESVAWASIGADLRIDARSGGRLDPSIDATAIAAVDGVHAAADARSEFAPPITAANYAHTPTLLHAIDIEGYASVVAGTPVDVAFPPIMTETPAVTNAGSTAIPALVSRRLPNGWPDRSIGDTFELDVHGQPLTFIVSGVADVFPGIPSGTTFAVVPLSQLTAALGGTSTAITSVYVRADASATDDLAALAAAPLSSADVASRYATLALVRDAPLVAAVGTGFLLALAIAVGYAALAVMAIVALDSARRARELAYLRTMGLSDRQMIGLTMVEHTPPVAVALVIGIVLGLALAWLLEPGLDLAAYIDPASPVAIAVDRPAIVVVAAIVVAVVALAVAASSIVARHLNPAQALRMDAR
jgi:FtsX-like permease family